MVAATRICSGCRPASASVMCSPNSFFRTEGSKRTCWIAGRRLGLQENVAAGAAETDRGLGLGQQILAGGRYVLGRKGLGRHEQYERDRPAGRDQLADVDCPAGHMIVPAGWPSTSTATRVCGMSKLSESRRPAQRLGMSTVRRYQ